MDSTSRFIPTLARARQAGLPLPDGEPFEQEKWSGLFVIAAVLRRRSWKEDIYATEEAVARLGSGPPAPPETFAAQSAAAVESIGEVTPCVACSLSPGKRRCRVCNGTSFVREPRQKAPVRCSCTMGYVPCPNCFGKASTHRITLRYYEDTPAMMRELWIPSHLPCYPPLFGLEGAMEEAVVLAQEPPEELRCHDLTGRVGGSAYRGGTKQVRPSFEGHDFGDTIDRALEQLKALGGGFQVSRYEVRAYAWPLLRLRYQNPKDPASPLEAALYCDRLGGVRVFRKN